MTPHAPGPTFTQHPAVVVRRLVRTRAYDVPPGAAFVAMARFGYLEGAFFDPAAGAGPVSVYVERGSLTFHAQGAVGVGRADGAVEPIPVGSAFTLTAGDRLLMPGGVIHDARSNGPGPASTLGVAIFAGAPAQEFPPGVTFHPLAVTQSFSLPPGYAMVTLERLHFENGAHEGGRAAPGVELAHVESGSLALRVYDGEARVSRAASGPFAPPEVVTRGEAILGPGDSVVAEVGISAGLYAAQGPATVLRAVVEPVPGYRPPPLPEADAPQPEPEKGGKKPGRGRG
ncbi:MAG TPA: hypothetical protein VGB66_04615 [Longimicrobium sp.]|jgi:hypothetical protein